MEKRLVTFEAMRRAPAIAAIALGLVACTATPGATPSPSGTGAAAAPTPSDGVVTALSEPAASPSADAPASPGASTSASPTPFVTPTPLLGDAPAIPVGRAANVIGEIPPAGMVRVSGQVFKAPKVPAPGICVTLGPPIACAVLTDAAGKWVIDVPQGKITWEFHFLRDREEVGPRVTIDGPFRGDTVAVESVTVR